MCMITPDDYAIEIDLPEGMYEQFERKNAALAKENDKPLIVAFEESLKKKLSKRVAKFMVIDHEVDKIKE